MSDRESPDNVGTDSVGWRRWRMGELNTGRSRPQTPKKTGETRPDRSFQQQAELQALRKRVRDEAHKEGYETGLGEGREAGYADGLAAGRETAERELHEKLAQNLAPLSGLIDDFQEALGGLDDIIATELVDLALATGRQLAGEALRTQPEQVLETVREMLHQEPVLPGQPRLHLHPEDLALVRHHLENDLANAGWKLLADDQLQRGGCRLVSTGGELDATLETRWQAIATRVRRRFEGGEIPNTEPEP